MSNFRVMNFKPILIAEILFMLFLVLSCTGRTSQDDVLQVVDVEGNLDNFQNISLNELGAEIKYISLESGSEIMMRGVYHIDLSGDYIFVSDKRKCILYNSQGKFLRLISKRGSGPGEYRLIRDVKINNNKFFLQSIYGLLEYDINGVFSDKIPLPRIENSVIESWIPINDTLFFGHMPCISGNEPYTAVVFSRSSVYEKFLRGIDRSYRNPEIKGSGVYLRDASLFRFRDLIYFKEMLGDTLFRMNKENQLEPELVFSLGNHTPSYDKRFNLLLDERINYVFISNIYRVNNIFFLDCLYGKYVPVKRQTPVDFAGASNWYYTTSILGIYDLNTSRLSFNNITATENILSQTGLINDIDGGPRFYPSHYINDSTLCMWIRAYDLITHVKSEEFADFKPANPKRKNQLLEFANSLSVDDNPVLMLATFKE